MKLIRHVSFLPLKAAMPFSFSRFRLCSFVNSDINKIYISTKMEPMVFTVYVLQYNQLCANWCQFLFDNYEVCFALWSTFKLLLQSLTLPKSYNTPHWHKILPVMTTYLIVCKITMIFKFNNFSNIITIASKTHLWGTYSHIHKWQFNF